MEDKMIEELNTMFHCSYSGDCMGSEDSCKKCSDYVLNYEDFIECIMKNKI